MEFEAEEAKNENQQSENIEDFNDGNDNWGDSDGNEQQYMVGSNRQFVPRKSEDEKDLREDYQYEADWQTTTVYHRGNNEGRHMNEYEFLGKLGRGSFGKVKKVQRTYFAEDNVTQLTSYYAAKIFNKNSLEYQRTLAYNDEGEQIMTNRLEIQYSEIKVYKHLDHPNICKLYQVIDDDTDEKMYLILEYCDLGQLMQWNEDTQRYEENPELDKFVSDTYAIQVQAETEEQKLVLQREGQAKIIFGQIAKAVEYLHSKNVVNRDIKIDNILGVSTGEKGDHLKLADFSTVKMLKVENEKLRECSGTSGFRCPEQQFELESGYDGKAADIWSLGITLITYVNFSIPFWASSAFETDLQAKNNPIQYNEFNSKQLIDLVESMCAKSEKDRITIEQVIAHPFFSTEP